MFLIDLNPRLSKHEVTLQFTDHNPRLSKHEVTQQFTDHNPRLSKHEVSLHVLITTRVVSTTCCDTSVLIVMKWHKSLQITTRDYQELTQSVTSVDTTVDRSQPETIKTEVSQQFTDHNPRLSRTWSDTWVYRSQPETINNMKWHFSLQITTRDYQQHEVTLQFTDITRVVICKHEVTLQFTDHGLWSVNCCITSCCW